MRFLEEQKLVSCVHCGLCLPSCPTYVELGSEADSPRGRILLLRALEEGRLAPTPEAIAHLDACLGCRACETACPSGVPYGSLIEAARPFLERHRSRPARVARRLLAAALARPTPRRLLFAPLRAAGGSRPLRAAARALAATPLGPWLAYAAATPPARGGAPLPRATDPPGVARGTALYLPGCVAETAFPETARATIGLLARAGLRVIVPERSGCCGALSLHLGDAEGAREHARALLAALPAERFDWIVPSAAGCGAFLRELAHVAGDAAAIADLAARVCDPLALLARIGLPVPERRLDAAVAVHDPCHLAHGQGVREEPRALLRAIPGVRLVELVDSDTCCGSAGTYNLTEPGMAARLRERKLDRVAESGADVVAAANPGCLLQIRAGAIARGLEVAVEHPIDLLAAAHGVVPPRPRRPRSGGAATAPVVAAACALALALAYAAAACSRGEGEKLPPTPTATAAAGADESPISAADAAAIERTIRAQLAAIAVGDAATAFSFAAPAIQEMFGTPENFLSMVRTAYPPLVAPRDVRFAPPMLVAGEVTQKVLLVDAQGRPGAALFLMDRTSGGRWQILGCVLAPREKTLA